METKKVLLVAAGGRAMPDVLALFYIQPHIVIAVTSEQGWIGEKAFVDIAKGRPYHEFLDFVRDVNAYDFGKCEQACDATALEIVHKAYPDTDYQLEWFFAISSSPKITGIAAYEVARKKNIPCLVVDTQNEKIISLVKEVTTDVDVNEFFHPDVARYMRIQRRTYRVQKDETVNYRKTVQDWGQIARELALSPDTPSFTSIMYKAEAKAGARILLPPELIGSSLIRALEKYKILEVKSNEKGKIWCSFTSPHAARFAGTGDWLEIFVWHEAKEAGFADDCQWGYEIFDGKAANELDLALTYKAQLLIGECKTGNSPFQRKYLDTLDTNAHLLGGNFVTKLFITNQPQTREGYASFNEQADKRRIVVLTAEDLPTIREHLEKHTKTPRYPRM